MRAPVLKRSTDGRPKPRLFDRARLLDGLAILVLIAVMAAALVALFHSRVADAYGPSALPPPVSATLDRCRRAGPPAGDDPACRAAWADARKAFFQIEEPQP